MNKKIGSKNQCSSYQYMSNSIFLPASICSQRKSINGQVNRLDNVKQAMACIAKTAVVLYVKV